MNASRPWQETRAQQGRYQPVGNWASQAACKHAAPAMEMPAGKGISPTYRRRHITAARLICKGCAVKAECLEWALTTPDPADGMVAGGLTPSERDRARPAAMPVLITRPPKPVARPWPRHIIPRGTPPDQPIEL